MKFKSIAILSLGLSFLIPSLTMIVPRSALAAEKTTAQKMKTSSPVVEECLKLVAKRTAVQAQLQAEDAKLQGLVIDMKKAKRPQKFDALAKVVEELVEQRKATNGLMMRLEPEIMHQLLVQLRTGIPDTTVKTMEMCPMFREPRKS